MAPTTKRRLAVAAACAVAALLFQEVRHARRRRAHWRRVLRRRAAIADPARIDDFDLHNLSAAVRATDRRRALRGLLLGRTPARASDAAVDRTLRYVAQPKGGGADDGDDHIAAARAVLADVRACAAAGADRGESDTDTDAGSQSDDDDDAAIEVSDRVPRAIWVLHLGADKAGGACWSEAGALSNIATN